jgi:hypothetical protein
MQAFLILLLNIVAQLLTERNNFELHDVHTSPDSLADCREVEDYMVVEAEVAVAAGVVAEAEVVVAAGVEVVDLADQDQ